MESKLNELPDRILELLCLQIIKSIESYRDFELNDDFFKKAVSVAKSMGLNRDVIDIDYIYNLINLNWDLLKTGEKGNKLERPSLVSMEVEVTEHETVYRKNYYMSTLPCYSTLKTDKYTIYDWYVDYEDYEYWDYFVDHDYGDSDVTDISRTIT